MVSLTNQQRADITLAVWQNLRHLSHEQRLAHLEAAEAEYRKIEDKIREAMK